MSSGKIICFALLPTLFSFAALGAINARARTPVVLELFTSEGCSSCPPADKLLQRLDETQPFANADLIVLSEHVDYWNGSAWKDPYSSELFTDRQSQYAKRLGVESIYTPELIIDGRSEGVGSNALSIKTGIEKALAERKLNLSLTEVGIDGGKLGFHVASSDAASRGLTLYIAVAENYAQTQVRGGENDGRLLSHVAVVRSLTAAVSITEGRPFDKTLSVQLPRSGRTENLRVVAFLQASGNGAIVAAAQIRIKDVPLY